MAFGALSSPVIFLKQMLAELPDEHGLREYEGWWEAQGRAISAAVDRAGTPWLRMFDRFGERTDEILYTPEYRRMLITGYRAGVVWRVFEADNLSASYLLGYVTFFNRC